MTSAVKEKLSPCTSLFGRIFFIIRKYPRRLIGEKTDLTLNKKIKQNYALLCLWYLIKFIALANIEVGKGKEKNKYLKKNEELNNSTWAKILEEIG